MLPENPHLDILSEDDVRVAGTRVGIEHLLQGYQAGAIPEQLAVEFPSVTLEQIHGVIAYYLGNQKVVDAYLQRWRKASLQRQSLSGNAADVVLRLRELAKERAAR